jgi:hypothetical protein
MELYRVFGFDPKAKKGEPGHPGYLFPAQGSSRWDNPAEYRAWYYSLSAPGAIGEVFGNLARWSEQMFNIPYLPNGRRALAVFSVPDYVALMDLDDPANLLSLNTRPSEIVIRNPGFTQQLASTVFNMHVGDNLRRYCGVRWWSFHRPQWTNVMLWETETEPAPATLIRVEPLGVNHPAVIESAAELGREFRTPL